MVVRGAAGAARHKVIGLILVKELAMVDKSAHTLVSSLKMRSLPFLRADTPLYDLLRLFETGRCHMAVLTAPPAQPPGDPTSDPPAGPHSASGPCSEGATVPYGHASRGGAIGGPSEGGHGPLISAEHQGITYNEVGFFFLSWWESYSVPKCNNSKHKC